MLLKFFKTLVWNFLFCAYKNGRHPVYLPLCEKRFLPHTKQVGTHVGVQELPITCWSDSPWLKQSFKEKLFESLKLKRLRESAALWFCGLTDNSFVRNIKFFTVWLLAAWLTLTLLQLLTSVTPCRCRLLLRLGLLDSLVQHLVSKCWCMALQRSPVSFYPRSNLCSCKTLAWSRSARSANPNTSRRQTSSFS